jgi:O-antigen/teichoic acid export membrane protein
MEHRAHAKRAWKSLRQLFFLVIGASVVAALIYAIGIALVSPRGIAVAEALSKLVEGLPPDEQLIGHTILKNFEEYRHYTVLWSAVNFSCLFLSAAFSAFAGLVLKLEFFLKDAELKKDIAASLAMFAALLITLSTVGDFQRKWQSNRLAATQMENLGYAFITADRKDALADFSRRIQEINTARNQGIIGTDLASQIGAPKGQK